LIDDHELIRVAYRFAGEVVDVEELLARGEKAPPPKFYGTAQPSGSAGGPAGPGRPGGIDIDPITGEPKGIDSMSPKM
jgi:hypothetical protein